MKSANSGSFLTVDNHLHSCTQQLAGWGRMACHAKSSPGHLSTWLLHSTSKYRLARLSKVVLQSAADDSPVVNEYLNKFNT